MGDYLDFKAIAENIDVVDVAEYLGLKTKREKDSFRCTCPVCDTERGLEIIPNTNSFACYGCQAPAGKKHVGGDIIALVAHVKGYSGMYKAAKELHAHFSAARGTAPQKEKGRANVPAPFDPAKFAAKLEYTEEVEALGIAEADAKALGIGCQRGRVYFPIRNDDGSVAGFIGFKDGEKPYVPETWLHGNVVPLRKKA
jgi:DNA primase